MTVQSMPQHSRGHGTLNVFGSPNRSRRAFPVGINPTARQAGKKALRKPACKPGFVSASVRMRRRSFLLPRRCRRGHAANPRVAGPDQSYPLIRPCSRWGLPSQPVARLLVGSYPAVSPLPRLSGSLRKAVAVCFLLHFPYPRRPTCEGRLGRWTLSTTLSCGARTFLPRAEARRRPSGRLAKRGHCRDEG